MNRTTIINRANEILEKLGKAGMRSIGVDRDGDDIVIGCTIYEYDKLRITSGLLISYDSTVVFNTENNTYIPGSWENLFNSIYAYLPELVEKKRQEQAKQERGREFYRSYLSKYCNSDYKMKKQYADALKQYGIVATYESKSHDFYEQHDYEQKWRIREHGATVYYATQWNYGDMNIQVFKEGPWTREFIQTLSMCDQLEKERKDRERENSIQDSIKKLRREFGH